MPQNEREQLSLDLSREEQWVVHHVLLDRIESERQSPEDADPPSLAVFRAFEKLEAGTHRFSPSECRCLEDELRQYADADGIPDCDLAATKRVLKQIE